jgi:hypothetical protein
MGCRNGGGRVVRNFWTYTKIFVYKIFLAALTCYIKKIKQNGTK